MVTDSSSPAVEHRVRARRRIRLIVWVSAGFIVVGALTLWILPDVLLRNWFPDLPSAERAPFLGPAAQIVLFGLGGVIAIVGVGLSVARHAEELLAAELDRERATLERDRNMLSVNSHRFEQEVESHRREEAALDRDGATERAFRARFISSVEMLTVNGAIKRTAGLYALAALADDWIQFKRRDEAQVCINVLCGYLRSPLTIKVDETPSEEAAVRVSGYSIIRSRLLTNENQDPAWSGFTFELREAPLSFDVTQDNIVIGKNTVIDLSGAAVDGKTVTMGRLKITNNGKLRMDGLKLHGDGRMLMRNASLADYATLQSIGTTLMDRAQLTISRVKMTENADVELSITASRSAQVTFSPIQDDDSTARVEGIFEDESSLRVRGTTIRSGAHFDIEDVTLSDEAYISLSQASVSDKGIIAVDDAILRASGLEFDAEARPTKRGELLQRKVLTEAGRSSFGSNVTIRAGRAISTRPGLDGQIADEPSR